jgi:CheY-like chemotaxis protein
MGGSNELEGRRVLIVEDEAVVSLMIADLLSDAGCIVVGPAATTKAAFAFIEEESIDCAVLDVKLTDGLAFPVADALMARGVPFVFATGYDRTALDSRYIAAPLVGKVFDRSDLLSALVALVGHKNPVRSASH